jgi:Fibronectin type III domain
MTFVERSRCRSGACWLVVRMLALLVGLVVVSGKSFAGQLKLAWDPVANATGYRLYYGTSSGNYSSSVDAQNQTIVTVSGLTDGARYYLAVKAYDSTTTSNFSNEVSGVVPASSATSSPFGVDTTPPAQPQGLRIRAQ